MKLLAGYLSSLGLDFHDLQDSLDQIEGKVPKRLEMTEKLLEEGLEKLGDDPDFCRRVASQLENDLMHKIGKLERRVQELEGRAGIEHEDEPSW